MNRFEKLFADPKTAAETILSIQCLNADEYEDCDGCPFWELGDGWRDVCPQYKQGIKNDNGPQSIEEWLAVEI